MKALIILCCLPFLFSSCFTFKNLTKAGVTKEIIPKLKVGKLYSIETKSGSKMLMRITKIDSIKIYGTAMILPNKKYKYQYQESCDVLIQNSKKISVNKFNPYVTTVSICGITFFGYLYIREDIPDYSLIFKKTP